MSKIAGIDCTIKSVFYALIAAFIFILAQFFVPAVTDQLRGPLLFLGPFAIFSLLGLALVILTLKKGVEGKLKKFLILTGASAAGFFVGVVLHNFFYALGVLTSSIAVLHYLMEMLHVIFFFVAVPICPIGFIIGAIASLILLLKTCPSKSH